MESSRGQQLRVAWPPSADGASARNEEKRLLTAFAAQHDGAAPADLTG